MIRRLTTLLPAFGLALVLANAGHLAKAGYVSSGLECVRGDAAPVDLEIGASTGSAQAIVAPDQPVVAHASQNSATIKAPAAFSSSGGMSPPEVESTGQQLDIVIVQHSPDRAQRMAEWMGAEGRAALPPPMATGIFRPP